MAFFKITGYKQMLTADNNKKCDKQTPLYCEKSDFIPFEYLQLSKYLTTRKFEIG
jgi:hypothetical protein